MLTKDKRRALRTEAHSLKPELNVGKDGFSPRFVHSLREAFNSKELLKIRMLDTCPDDRKALRARLEQLEGIDLVAMIGNTFILYQEMDEERRKARQAAKGDRKSAAPGRKPASRPPQTQPAPSGLTRNLRPASSSSRPPRKSPKR